MLLISSSYFKTKCTRALHIVYPDEKKSLTVNNGIKFTIFGDANTVAIPIVVEVV